MKIFITGATGFVGHHVLQRLIDANHSIIALCRHQSSSKRILHPLVRWVEGDLDGDYQDLFFGVDAFVHLASHTPNHPYDDLSRCIYWNVYASIKLAEQSVMAGVNQFIIAGTCFEYGLTADSQPYVSPADRAQPNLSYPISKYVATEAFLGLAREKNLKLKVLRLFQVYGEGEQEFRFWPSLRRAAIAGEDFDMSDGLQVRDFINVTKVADKFVQELDFADVKEGDPLVKNVASGQEQTLRQFAECWWKEWGAKGKLNFGTYAKRKNEVKRLIPKL